MKTSFNNENSFRTLYEILMKEFGEKYNVATM